LTESVSYLATAKKLIDGKSSESDIRRAVSTAYYAMFHHVCLHFGDIVVQPDQGRFVRAWLQAYRYIDHGVAKSRCTEVRSKKLGFPPNLVVFAETFLDLQQRRLDADYNPEEAFTESDARALITSAELAIRLFDAEPIECRRAFVVFLGLQPKRGR
jgi:hypothetical protein